MIEMQSMNDEQIQEEIHRLRKQLERIQLQLESGQGTVEHQEMRAKMGDLNHLKIEARRRGLQENA